MLQPDWKTPPLSDGADEGRFALAIELAIAAGNSTLPFFKQRNFQLEKKSDRSPVTNSDRASETLIRDAVKKHFPADAILGEEFGEQAGTSDYRWIVDPIDGTKSFISGVPLYSTLLAICVRDEPQLGIIYMPALGQIVVGAKSHGAWTNDQLNGCIAASVSDVATLDESVFVTTQVDSFPSFAAYQRLESECMITRSWGDGYGYYLVATGRAELMIDPIVNAWDVAAVMPVILEAGGMFSDWNGEVKIDSGHGIGSNGKVHAVALNKLRTIA